jgi:hypothetical protein
MIVNILKPFHKWKPGDTPDIDGTLLRDLVEQGIAVIHGDQTRRDYIPKPPEEKQPITVVNNYYLSEADADGEEE